MAGFVSLLFKLARKRNPPARTAIEHQLVDATHVADYLQFSATTYRVRTLRDVLPGGLCAAMTPAFVVWEQSTFAPGGSITIRNLNHGGNPVSGITVLRTAVLRPERVKSVEYTKVPLGGHDSISHGQLRFIFEPGGIVLLDGDAGARGEPESIDDIVLSWEAWRPPGARYSVLRGLDPGAYYLTMRAYSGVQRFIEDALQNRNWDSYPLSLPGGRDGVIELLKVSLTMGDGGGRYVVSELLKHTGESWVMNGPREKDGDAAGHWRDVKARADNTPAPSDARLDLVGRTGYHSALRSCASMALYQIDVAATRLKEQGHGHVDHRPLRLAGIDHIPEWMTELADASVAGMFLRGPRAIAYVRKYPTTIPGRIPKKLDAAGLLQRHDGKPVKLSYTMRDTPWGPGHHLLIR